jgi:hypothetical protein
MEHLVSHRAHFCPDYAAWDTFRPVLVEKMKPLSGDLCYWENVRFRKTYWRQSVWESIPIDVQSLGDLVQGKEQGAVTGAEFQKSMMTVESSGFVVLGIYH